MILPNSASSAAALVSDLPLCTLTDIEGKPREDRQSPEYILVSSKNIIFNEHPVSYTRGTLKLDDF